MRHLRCELLLGAFAIRAFAAAPCPMPRETAGTTLDELAKRYLGDARYAVPIALATNARIGQGFHSISHPHDLSEVPRVCVPSKSEARRLLSEWRSYGRAVEAARLAPDVDTGGLVTIPQGKPADFVTWDREDEVRRLKTASGQWAATVPDDTWVTAEPYLKDFCAKFVRGRKTGEAALALRLEQRLGLPPASDKTYFVQIRLERPGPGVLFRPCSNPDTGKSQCHPGPPAANEPAAYQEWFYRLYYSSYGASLLGEFPWTALGYTFDWALQPGDSREFVRNGESEFVIPQGTAVEIRGAVKTANYCSVSEEPRKK